MKYKSHGNFFALPNEIFLWGLTTGELAVYSFLRRCEDRKTRQCWPSIKTIGKGVQQPLPVLVKGVVVVVGVGVEQRHGSHLFSGILILRTIITRPAEKKRARIGKSPLARKQKRTSERMSFWPDMISRSC